MTETYVEWRTVWPDGSVLPCSRDEGLARRWATKSALERDPTPRRDPFGARRLTGTAECRRVVVEDWQPG